MKISFKKYRRHETSSRESKLIQFPTLLFSGFLKRNLFFLRSSAILTKRLRNYWMKIFSRVPNRKFQFSWYRFFLILYRMPFWTDDTLNGFSDEWKKFQLFIFHQMSFLYIDGWKVVWQEGWYSFIMKRRIAEERNSVISHEYNRISLLEFGENFCGSWKFLSD